jgi:hypothetical protein
MYLTTTLFSALTLSLTTSSSLLPADAHKRATDYSGQETQLTFFGTPTTATRLGATTQKRHTNAATLTGHRATAPKATARITTRSRWPSSRAATSSNAELSILRICRSSGFWMACTPAVIQIIWISGSTVAVVMMQAMCVVARIH